MNRRAFLAGLLASTAMPPRLLAYEPPPVVWSVVSGPFSYDPSLHAMRDWSNLAPSDLTLAALDELAAAVRCSFEPENYRRYITASSSWSSSL